MSQLRHKNNDTLIIASLALCLLLSLTGVSAQENKSSGPFSAETVLLTTDRTIYLSGETVFLTATVIEADNFRFSDLSKVVRIELLNSKGTTGVRHILYSDSSTMAASFRLPANLPTGWYRLRAYTSWMRNMGPSLFSYRDLRIVNPSDAASLKDYAGGDTLKVSVIAGNETALTGSPNPCAVRSMTLSGRPIPVKGSIITGDNMEVAQFSTGATGWGRLTWTPEEGESYHIILDTDPGMELITELPRHSDRALIVHLSERQVYDRGESDNITLTISGNIPDTGIKLLVHRLSSWYLYNEAFPGDDRISFLIPTSDLPDGLLSFTILDNDNRVLTSTLWIKGDLRGSEPELQTVKADREGRPGLLTEYQGEGTGDGGFYTITTRRREPVETSDLYIGAIPGWPSDWKLPADMDERAGWLIANAYEDHVAESFFNEGEKEPAVPLLNFLDITDTRHSVVQYLPETRGVKISGTLSTEDGRPAGLQKLSLTCLNDKLFMTSRTFSDGSFYFTFPGREGSKDLILSLTGRPLQKMNINISPEYEPRVSALPPGKIYLTSEEISYVNDLIIDLRLDNIYRDTISAEEAPGKNKQADRAMFYGNPDHVVFIDDYIRLPDMRELIFEVVPYVSVRKEGDDYTLKIINEEPRPRNYDPLILIDGIPLLSFTRFLELPPDRFTRVDIINSIYIHGNQIFDGIVNFTSVNGDLAGLDLPEGSRILSVDLPSPSPRGDVVRGKSYLDDVPSLEYTLSFMPVYAVIKGSHYLSGHHVPGDYITVVTGLDSEGKWVSSSFAFEVAGSYIR